MTAEPDIGHEVDHLADCVARLAQLVADQYAAMNDQLRLMRAMDARIDELEEKISTMQGRSLRLVERKN